MKKLILSAASLFLILFLGCPNIATDEPVIPTKTSFKLTFTNGRVRGQGYAILHRADGKDTVVVKSYSDNSTIDFGTFTENVVCFTYIDVYTDNGRKYINITSDINAPSGEWKLDGRKYSNKGRMSVTMNFPQINFNCSNLGAVGLGYGRGYSTMRNSNSERFSNIIVNYLNTDNTISLFGSVLNSVGDSAYCGWVNNQSFKMNDTTNAYSLNLTKPMDSKIVSINRSVKSLSIGSIVNSGVDIVYNAYSYFGTSEQPSSPKVFYSAEFPKDRYFVSLSNNDTLSSYSYFLQNVNIPSSISIPTSTITGNYNASLNRYENISVSGTIDQIYATWYYTSADYKLNINWIVYAPGTTSEITRPTIPQEVLSQIPELNLSLLKTSSLGLQDYDSASSMEDIITMFFKTASPYYSKYNSYYTYSKTIKN